LLAHGVLTGLGHPSPGFPGKSFVRQAEEGQPAAIDLLRLRSLRR